MSAKLQTWCLMHFLIPQFPLVYFMRWTSATLIGVRVGIVLAGRVGFPVRRAGR